MLLSRKISWRTRLKRRKKCRSTCGRVPGGFMIRMVGPVVDTATCCAIRVVSCFCAKVSKALNYQISSVGYRGSRSAFGSRKASNTFAPHGERRCADARRAPKLGVAPWSDSPLQHIFTQPPQPFRADSQSRRVFTDHSNLLQRLLTLQHVAHFSWYPSMQNDHQSREKPVRGDYVANGNCREPRHTQAFPVAPAAPRLPYYKTRHDAAYIHMVHT